MHINNYTISKIIKPNTLKFFSAFIGLIFLSSCASSKKLNYFNDEDKNEPILKQDIINYAPTVQYGDMLNVNVTSIEPELAIPFNIMEIQDNRMIRQIPYLVNADGTINFPVLGKIKVDQMTTQEVTRLIHERLLPYLKDPTVTVQLMNFKVSVLGEVSNPGSFTILNERINIPEALALAGDLTIYGKRKTITLIREQNNTREFIPIDLTDKSIFSSPYYYLSQNDILYIESNKTRVNSSKVGPNTSLLVSSLSILISLAAILIN